MRAASLCGRFFHGCGCEHTGMWTGQKEWVWRGANSKRRGLGQKKRGAADTGHGLVHHRCSRAGPSHQHLRRKMLEGAVRGRSDLGWPRSPSADLLLLWRRETRSPHGRLRLIHASQAQAHPPETFDPSSRPAVDEFVVASLALLAPVHHHHIATPKNPLSPPPHRPCKVQVETASDRPSEVAGRQRW